MADAKDDQQLWNEKTATAVKESGHLTDDQKTAEAKRRSALKNNDEANERQVAALLRERASLQQAGKDDRVKAVDAELKARGYSESDKQEARKQQPQGRSSRPQQQADKD